MTTRRRRLPRSLWGRLIYANIIGDIELRDAQTDIIRSRIRSGGREQFEITNRLSSMLLNRVFRQRPSIAEIDELITEARGRLQNPDTMPFLEAEALVRSWLGDDIVDIGGIDSKHVATIGGVISALMVQRLRLSPLRVADAIIQAEHDAEAAGVTLVLD